MKFTISYKFKLKMAQILSGRSGSVPVPLVPQIPVPLTDRKKSCSYKLLLLIIIFQNLILIRSQDEVTFMLSENLVFQVKLG